ncbi:MAG TPA: FKBP-type peptidyl-prolyl cis-trans isomerase [Thermoanaerobaculia bacterium]|jgi:peptidylprolyl isomerase
MNRRFFSWIPALLLASTPLLAAPPQASISQPIPPPADVAAPPADAQVTASGLASKVLTPGTGTEHPLPTDMVKVNYTGWTTDGKSFDSSVSRGRPVVLPLGKVIAGWGEGLQLMVVGEKRRLWIPAKLAYEGKEGKPQGMLVFDVELLDVLRVPPAPADVAAPPADAQRSKSGLAWKVLKPGTGARTPKATSTVRVHYTGWTTDGKMFDSSIAKGAAATFELTKVIPGWTEGLQMMTEGETRRFWIPSRQAYDGVAGKPKGMLVFDIALLEVVKE